MELNTELDYYVWLELSPTAPELPTNSLIMDNDKTQRLYQPVIGRTTTSVKTYLLFANPFTGEIVNTKQHNKNYSVIGVVSSLATVLTIQKAISDKDPSDDDTDILNNTLTDWLG